MNSFQIRHLRNFCRKHGLDEHLIDNTLTYSENKDYLASLVPNFDPEERLDEWSAMEEWYMENHFLEYYIGCIMEGHNRSLKVGPVDTSKPFFSIQDMKHIEGFSLSAFTHQRKA